MRVYLCRHGEAVDNTGLGTDESRFLTQPGRQGILRVGQALRAQGDVPDLILTSPLVRAVQTAELLASAVGYDKAVEVNPALVPETRLGQLLDELIGLEAKTRVFLVGHEPQMGQWTAQLLGRTSLKRPFSKGGVARIDWEGVPERGTGQAVFFLSPQQLQPTAI